MTDLFIGLKVVGQALQIFQKLVWWTFVEGFSFKFNWMVSALYFENLYGRPFIGLKVLGNENRFVNLYGGVLSQSFSSFLTDKFLVSNIALFFENLYGWPIYSSVAQ